VCALCMQQPKQRQQCEGPGVQQLALLMHVCVAVQVGDGTTTVVILSGELLRAAKPFVEEGVHPRVRGQGQQLLLSVCPSHCVITVSQTQPQRVAATHEAVPSSPRHTPSTPASLALP
jgi:hypothetical protein